MITRAWDLDNQKALIKHREVNYGLPSDQLAEANRKFNAKTKSKPTLSSNANNFRVGANKTPTAKMAM